MVKNWAGSCYVTRKKYPDLAFTRFHIHSVFKNFQSGGRNSSTLGTDHLTFEGGGGEGWVISGQQEFFILAIGGAGFFFPFFLHKLSITFVLHAIFSF